MNSECVLGINDILLAQDVSRWTIVKTIGNQNLATHSYNVCMISRAIAKEFGIDDSNVMKYAIDHDLAEILTGDIPTPAKERLGIRAIHAGTSKQKCGHTELIIVKVADILDAIMFIRDNKCNRHGEVVYQYLIKKFSDLRRSLEPKLAEAVTTVITAIDHAPFEVENRS